MPSLRSTHPLAIALAALTALAALLLLGPAVARPASPVDAAVVHVDGYEATVLGWHSWYGSYDLGGLGPAWCLDHGIAAPDPDFAYEPASVDDASPEARAAMAWAVSQNGLGADPLRSAALMLVLHDLMDAEYPHGVIDVDGLGADGLDGFDGAEAAVLDTARAIKADAVAHASLRGPFVLAVDAAPVGPGEPGALRATVRDATGAPVPALPLTVAASGATAAASAATTGADGSATVAFTAGDGDNRFDVSSRVPDTSLHAFAPTTGEAQRVAVPGLVQVEGTTSFVARRPGRVVVHKTGDAEPFLPVTGARFRIGVADAGGDDSAPVPPEVTIGPDGTAPPVELAPGRYVVREVEPPPGYDAGDPVAVDVPAGETVTLEIANHARPGRLVVRKVDPDGNALNGAVFRVDGDADLDGTYETPGDDIAVDGSATVDDLRPGHYLVTERTAPAGYEPATPRAVVVPPGETVDVVVVDAPIPSSATTSTTSTTSTSTTSTSTTSTTSTTTPQPLPAVTTTTPANAAPVRPAPRLPTTGMPLLPLGAGGLGLVVLGRALLRRSRR